MFNSLRKQRLLKDMSQTKLADKIGTTRVTISNIERGFSTPSGETMLSIAEALGIPVEEIFFKDNDKQVLQKETIV